MRMAHFHDSFSRVNPPTPEFEQATAAERTRWFMEEVHTHDASLRGYLNVSFPTVRGEVEEVVQESYLRIWKSPAGWASIRSAKAFLFRVARNVALDLLRHNKAAPFEAISHSRLLSVIEDGPTAAEAAARQERINMLAEAIAILPTRCREVFILHKIKGNSRREVAAQLGMSDRTVGVHTDRAVKRCVEYLRKRGVNGLFDDAG